MLSFLNVTAFSRAFYKSSSQTFTLRQSVGSFMSLTASFQGILQLSSLQVLNSIGQDKVAP